MPERIIKDGAIVEDNWQVVRELEGDLPSGNIIVPAQRWLDEKDALQARGNVAVWLASDQSPKMLGDAINGFELIAVDFPAFADGRGFSYGRELREQHGFSGDLRAIGNFMRDQLAYLSRCGFNSFALQNSDLEAALESLRNFSVHYQVSIDNPQPLFRARQG